MRDAERAANRQCAGCEMLAEGIEPVDHGELLEFLRAGRCAQEH
jgi:hypothetical protein